MSLNISENMPFVPLSESYFCSIFEVLFCMNVLFVLYKMIFSTFCSNSYLDIQCVPFSMKTFLFIVGKMLFLFHFMKLNVPFFYECPFCSILKENKFQLDTEQIGRGSLVFCYFCIVFLFFFKINSSVALAERVKLNLQT